MAKDSNDDKYVTQAQLSKLIRWLVGTHVAMLAVLTTVFIAYANTHASRPHKDAATHEQVRHLESEVTGEIADLSARLAKADDKFDAKLDRLSERTEGKLNQILAEVRK